MANMNGVFDAPIPGQSLTAPVGATPVEHPPKFVNLDDALEFTWARLHKPKTLVKLIGLVKAGAPVQSLVSTVLFRGVSESLWSVDLSLLMYQTVLWQVEAVLKLKKVPYQTFNQDRIHNNAMLSINNIANSKGTLDKTFTIAGSPTEELQQEHTDTKPFKGSFF